jgi:hypothetical protein
LADSVIAAVASSPHYELTLNRKGEPIRVGTTIVPSPHDRVRLLVPDWAAGYSLLSSPTHGAAWSSLGAIAAHQGGSTVETDLQRQTAALLAVAAIAQAAVYLADHTGADSAPIIAAVEELASAHADEVTRLDP